MQKISYKLVVALAGILFCVIAAVSAASKMFGFSISKRSNSNNSASVATLRADENGHAVNVPAAAEKNGVPAINERNITVNDESGVNNNGGATDKNTAADESGVSVTDNLKKQYSPAQKAGGGIIEKLPPEIITFYETNISKQPIISDINPVKLKKMAAAFGCTPKRYMAMLILKDLAARCGDELDIKDIAALSDLQIIVKGKIYVEKYADSLPEDEKTRLKEEFKKLDSSKLLTGK